MASTVHRLLDFFMYASSRVHVCCILAATPTTFAWKASMQLTRQVTHRLGPPPPLATIAGLQSGHKANAHLLDPAADPTCPLCKEEPQTLEHWLQKCQNLDALWQRTFSSPSPQLGVLTTDPKKVLALARATF